MCENKTSFYKRLNELDKRTTDLRTKYVRIRFLSVFLPISSFIIVLYLIDGIKRMWGIREVLSIHTIPNFTILGFVSTVILILIYRIIFIPSVRHFKEEYNTALELSNEIVDTADWTNFRKRQETDNKRIQVRDAVEDFYDLRNLKFFPYHTDSSKFRTCHLVYKLLYSIIMAELAIITIFMIFDIFI